MDNKEAYASLADVLEETANYIESGIGKQIRIGVTVLGSEHGEEEVVSGARLAKKQNSALEIILIGSAQKGEFQQIPVSTGEEAHSIMKRMLTAGQIDGAVTMHYNFPLGVATVGRVITPGKGKEMFLATTTGTSDTDRIFSMVKNALCGIAAAKACGLKKPSLGILNVEGARHAEKLLKQLQQRGYPLNLVETVRSDGGSLMRGNDLLLGTPDVMVTDSLTGNVLMKVLSAFNSGGNYETLGFGYGPGTGENYNHIICIISRASGANVIAGAIHYAADCVKGKLAEKTRQEFLLAKEAGLDELICSAKKEPVRINPSAALPPKVVTSHIEGIEIMDIEEALQALLDQNLYAESGMGCTGPIIQVAGEDREKALDILRQGKFI